MRQAIISSRQPMHRTAAAGQIIAHLIGKSEKCTLAGGQWCVRSHCALGPDGRVTSYWRRAGSKSGGAGVCACDVMISQDTSPDCNCLVRGRLKASSMEFPF